MGTSFSCLGCTFTHLPSSVWLSILRSNNVVRSASSPSPLEIAHSDIGGKKSEVFLSHLARVAILSASFLLLLTPSSFSSFPSERIGLPLFPPFLLQVSFASCAECKMEREREHERKEKKRVKLFYDCSVRAQQEISHITTCFNSFYYWMLDCLGWLAIIFLFAGDRSLTVGGGGGRKKRGRVARLARQGLRDIPREWRDKELPSTWKRNLVR